MATYSPVVACYEEFRTQQEDWDLEGPTASVQLRCAWADRHNLIADLLGNSRDWPHGPYTNPPQAQRASISPFATTQASVGQSITYDDALVSVEYGFDSRDLVSESLEPTAEFITLDHRRFRWGAADGPPLKQAEAPGKLRRGLTLQRTLYRQAPPLSTQLLTSVGGINDTAYVSSLLGLSFPQGTLLFTPPNLSISVQADGTDGYTIAMKFMYKPEGWNSFWRAESQAYEDIYLVGGAQYLNYPEVDMSDLL